MGMEGEAQMARPENRAESAGGEGLNLLKLMTPQSLEEAAGATGRAGSTLEELNAKSWSEHAKTGPQTADEQDGQISGKDESRLPAEKESEPSSRIEQAFDALRNSMPSVEKLPTGDFLTSVADTQILLTPNNDSVTVSKGGQQEVTGDLKSMRTDKDGVTTVTFADDATVSFDKNGIVEVTRDGVGIGFYQVKLPADGSGKAGSSGQQKGGFKDISISPLIIPPLTGTRMDRGKH